ncbi:hypothetical protein GCM10022408_21240 [Hymenobacter fastidiosus]|uniref:Uncharacterized protein n=1 Tax=Hymenobacter fastidiosus TaxID=486264 RepID=A0ABP7SA42_9BACT
MPFDGTDVDRVTLLTEAEDSAGSFIDPNGPLRRQGNRWAVIYRPLVPARWGELTPGQTYKVWAHPVSNFAPQHNLWQTPEWYRAKSCYGPMQTEQQRLGWEFDAQWAFNGLGSLRNGTGQLVSNDGPILTVLDSEGKEFTCERQDVYAIMEKARLAPPYSAGTAEETQELQLYQSQLIDGYIW